LVLHVLFGVFVAGVLVGYIDGDGDNVLGAIVVLGPVVLLGAVVLLGFEVGLFDEPPVNGTQFAIVKKKFMLDVSTV